MEKLTALMWSCCRGEIDIDEDDVENVAEAIMGTSNPDNEERAELARLGFDKADPENTPVIFIGEEINILIGTSEKVNSLKGDFLKRCLDCEEFEDMNNGNVLIGDVFG